MNTDRPAATPAYQALADAFENCSIALYWANRGNTAASLAYLTLAYLTLAKLQRREAGR